MFIEQKLKLSNDETEFLTRHLLCKFKELGADQGMAEKMVREALEEVQVIADKAFHFGLKSANK